MIKMLNLKYIFGIALGIAIFFLTACKQDISDDPIPPAFFEPIFINLNLPAYQELRTKGNMYIDGGVRGIIVYRLNNSKYLAFERNCSFQPNEACATVDVDVSNLFMLDACCRSSFEFATGNPNGGPAWRPLRQYQATLNGSNLTITDEIVN